MKRKDYRLVASILKSHFALFFNENKERFFPSHDHPNWDLIRAYEASIKNHAIKLMQENNRAFDPDKFNAEFEK